MSPFTLIFIFFSLVVMTFVLARIMKSILALFIVILVGWFAWGLLSPTVIDKVEMTTPIIEERIEAEQGKIDATIEKASSGSSIIRGIKNIGLSIANLFVDDNESQTGSTLDTN